MKITAATNEIFTNEETLPDLNNPDIDITSVVNDITTKTDEIVISYIVTYPTSNICFFGKSKVLTNNGYKPINKVTLSDKIQNKEIYTITKTKTKERHVVKITKDSIAPNMPFEDTFISCNHKILMNGVLISAYKLVNNKTILLHTYRNEILFNIVLKNSHCKMVVNGMIVETLHPDNNIAKLYKLLSNYTKKEQIQMIKIYNEEKIKKR